MSYEKYEKLWRVTIKMTDNTLVENIGLMIDALAKLRPEVLEVSDKDRAYPPLLRRKILGLVDSFINAEREALKDLRYKRSFGDDVLNAVLPMTHSLSVLEAMAQYGEDFALVQAYCDTKWSIGNCISRLLKLVPDRAKGY